MNWYNGTLAELRVNYGIEAPPPPPPPSGDIEKRLAALEKWAMENGYVPPTD